MSQKAAFELDENDFLYDVMEMRDEVQTPSMFYSHK